MKVLIIPEDPTYDQYILKPVVERIFKDLEIPARIEVLYDPHLQGVDQALSRQIIADIVDENRMVDLFLVIVDRDCNRFNNTVRAQGLEKEFASRLLACLALEEAEVWMSQLRTLGRGLATLWAALGNPRTPDSQVGGWPRISRACRAARITPKSDICLEG